MSAFSPIMIFCLSGLNREGFHAGLFITGACIGQGFQGVFCLFCHNVDDAVDGIAPHMACCEAAVPCGIP